MRAVRMKMRRTMKQATDDETDGEEVSSESEDEE